MTDPCSDDCNEGCDNDPPIVTNSPVVPSPDVAPANAAMIANVTGPRQVVIDGQSVEQHPLNDQIAADRYINSKAVTRQPGKGWRTILSRFVPPGSL